MDYRNRVRTLLRFVMRRIRSRNGIIVMLALILLILSSAQSIASTILTVVDHAVTLVHLLTNLARSLGSG